MPGQTVHADATKTFFISMLTKDITLLAAINDLVDNSIDGAHKKWGDGNYGDAEVRLTFGAGQFEIIDNGSGIDLKTAEEDAFRFGKDSDGAAYLAGSIGRFGVGMKRALFKMGNHFRVESQTTDSSFVVDVRVDDWSAQSGPWRFPWEPRAGLKVPAEETFTRVAIDELYEPVAARLSEATFESELIAMIADTHRDAISKGLSVLVNGHAVPPTEALLLAGPGLAPAHATMSVIHEESGAEVTIRVYAGLLKGRPADAGWYVYCNGRLILNADQTPRTGWGTSDFEAVPRFHNQYALFRGYVFLDSVNPEALPWNTTKTDVDLESAVFQTARSIMILTMRPIIAGLNTLKEELAGESEYDVLLAPAMASAIPESLLVIPNSSFTWSGTSAGKRGANARWVNVQFKRPRELVKKVCDALGVDHAYQAGEMTFDRFVRENEIDG